MKRLKPITSVRGSVPLFQGIRFQAHTDGRILATALDGYQQASVLAKCFEAPQQYLDFTILPFDVPKKPKCRTPPAGEYHRKCEKGFVPICSIRYHRNKRVKEIGRGVSRPYSNTAK